MKSKILSIIAIFLFSGLGAQKDSTIENKNTLIGYPVGFYLPETRWGFGGFGSYNFYLNKKDSISPPSQVQLGVGFTQNKQLLVSLPFEFYWNERKHSVTGEFSYSDYSYYFYGVGPGNEEGKRELYNVRFPRLRMNYLRKIRSRWFAGVRWWYENYQVYNLANDSWLLDENIPGGTGGITSGPGIVALYDSRDNVYFTLSGNYLELVAHNQDEIWGSEFDYNRYRFDYRTFIPTKERQAIALNLFGDFITGTVPFSQMPAAGNNKRMRGYYEGRYRDRNALVFQSEYRAYLYKRWGGVAFFNYAMLANDISGFNFRQDYASFGAGIRFAYDLKKRINFRLDAALPIGAKNTGEGSLFKETLFYFTIGEVF